jgi:hypothetical protein
MRIVRVHEHVGAGLQLVPNAARGLELVGAGACAGDEFAIEAVPLEQLDRLPHGGRGALDRGLALGEARHMLRGAVIGLQAAEAQARGVRDQPRQVARRLARRHAAAFHPHLDLHQRPERDAEVARHRAGGGDRLRRVEAERHRGVARERREAAQLVRADDLVADEHVPHAAVHQRLGLADLLAALPDRAERDLLQRDRRALVRLGVRAQAHAGPRREIRQLPQVVLERFELDDQRGRVDLVDRRADAGGGNRHCEVANGATVRR